MTTYYVHSNVTGNAADPITGRLKMCGPDTASADSPVGSDLNNGTSAATPKQTLFSLSGLVVSGDTVNIAGRHYADYAHVTGGVGMLDFTELSGVTVRQWSGKDPAVLYGCNLAGTTGWSASGNGFIKTIATSLSICALAFDYDDAANQDRYGTLGTYNTADLKGRRSVFLRPRTAAGVVRVRGAWVTATAYLIGDSVTNAGVTYVCITANTSTGAALLTNDSAKWESYATQKTAVTGAATGNFGAVAYDFASGELCVRLPTGMSPASPTANGVAYTVQTIRGVVFHGLSTDEALNYNNVIDGIDFYTFCDASNDSANLSPAGTPVFTQGGDSVRVRNSRICDAGLHAISYGGGCSNNLVENVVIVGMGNRSASNAIVFNATGTTGVQANPTHGCRGRNCRVVCNSLLDHSGVPFNRGSAVGDYYCHGSTPGGNFVTDVEWYQCHTDEYVPPSGSADVVVKHYADQVQAPSDTANPETCCVRFRQCDLTNGTFLISQGVTIHIAMINCTLSWTRQDALSNGFGVELTAVTGGYFYDGCAIRTTLRNTNGQAICAVFKIGAGAYVRMRNTSVYDMATAHTAAKVYAMAYLAAAGATITADGCIFGYRDTAAGTLQVVTGENGFAASAVDFDDCEYFNIDPVHWADDAARDTTAEWISTVDAAAVDNGSTNPFADVTGASLDLTTAARALRKFVSQHSVAGVNHGSYDGHYGAWQYGQSKTLDLLQLMEHI